jgi:hypothetical protein
MTLTALGMTMALGACNIGSTAIPRPDPLVVVHAVLDPSLSQQTILLEESLTGKAPEQGPWAADDPIATSQGIPIAGAEVQLEDENGAIYAATERQIAGDPSGIYIAAVIPQPGIRYRLTVHALGKTVTATTVVPRGVVATTAPLVPFNRNHDTAKVSIPQVEFARGYFLRIDAPIAAFSVVTTDRDIAITGDTRNLYTENLLRVFFPGFQQALTVAAADTNLFDYYRSRNDPFSGIGLINHVQGGLGVFGSVAVIERRVLDVTQDFSGHPLEDDFTRRDPAPDDVPQLLHFYRESSAETPDSQDRISGFYISGPASSPVQGPFLATILLGGTFDVQMFRPGTTADAAGSFRAYPVLPDAWHCCGPPDTLKVYVEGVPGVLNYVRKGK